MATNVNFRKLIPGTIDIPTGLTDFKNKEQVVWTGSALEDKRLPFTPGYGDTNYFTNTTASYSIQPSKRHV